ncbi:Uncharacterised protein [BD1-7 clade bacterium]|uniref:Uncharacterized protein n=1 Tax=BD1-7 clade bacterium TaxID=2029982 RepID=A0A5S9QJ84_9GAMM|nr:Uncharacterised protein [BD1-7 clade bacterium]CAA0118921.1 Uncharacterised protein [BD1-7 clade bacterium]
MKQITTDAWMMLLPEEWHAEQDDETIVITDEDEVSVIEISTLLPEKRVSVDELLQVMTEGRGHKTLLAELEALYSEFEEDDMYWREWFCKADNCVIAVSHGTDIDNRGMDDSTVDEILSTLAMQSESESENEEPEQEQPKKNTQNANKGQKNSPKSASQKAPAEKPAAPSPWKK